MEETWPFLRVIYHTYIVIIEKINALVINIRQTVATI